MSHRAPYVPEVSRRTHAGTWLWSLALGTLSAPLGSCLCGEDVGMHTQTFEIAALDRELGELLDRCVGDPTACAPLCAELIDRDGGYVDTMQRCDVDDTPENPVVTARWYDGTMCGRRPTGLVRHRLPTARDPLGMWLAHAAHLEAASVAAFVSVGVTLLQHAAPEAVVARVRRAALDEVLHARMLATLARTRGCPPPTVAVRGTHSATLAELAIENVIEGCVREMFGALVAIRQAHLAEALDVRLAFARIAPDEVAHAELAHDLHDWLWSRLDSVERIRVLDARAAALVRLREEVTNAAPDAIVRDAGWPTPAVATTLVTAVDRFWRFGAATPN